MQNLLKIPKLLGNGCVLQRRSHTRIWGWCAPLAQVQAILEPEASKEKMPLASLALTASEKGDFCGYFDDLAEGGPYRLRFICGRKEYVSRDVYIGDVFVCAGQSNMELPMSRVRVKYPEEFQEGAPQVHVYKVQEAYDFNRDLSDHTEAAWQACTPENLSETSAFSYFLGKILSEREQVPVGILNLSLGGTPIQAWMSERALKKYPACLEERHLYQDPAYCRALLEKAAKKEAAWQEELVEKERQKHPSEWKTILLPGTLAEAGEPDFCGSIRLKKKILLPREAAGAPGELYLGTLTDADQTWINGTFVGETAYRYPPRRYRIPPDVLREGENEITVRLVCRAGGGRMTKGKKPVIRTEASAAVSLAGEWKYRVLAEAEAAPEEVFINRTPTGLFQGMTAPCLPCTVRAVIWYQGESNDTSPKEYESLLRDMIEDWRTRWMQEKLPFVIVQLPNCGTDIAPGDAWPLIRQAQERVSHLPDTALTVNLDIGENNDLHPLNKKDAAERAALALEALVYKEKVCAQGPVLLSAGMSGDNPEVCLRFDRAVILNDCGDAAEAGDHALFELRNASGIWHPARVFPDGACLYLLPQEDMRPTAVRYAFSSTPGQTLLTGPEGLCVSPFEKNIEET